MDEELANFANPRFIRERFWDVRNDISQTNEAVRKGAERLDRHDELFSVLTALVQGNPTLGVSGVLVKISELSTMISSVKATQEESERERKRAQDRWKWIGLGLSFAALPGVKTLYDILAAVAGVSP